MFKIGEYVVHGRNGVCKIDDITKLEISGADKDKLYYVLVPMKSEQSKVFYPVDNNRVTMRSVISKDQAEDIVNEIKSIEPLWINNERLREAKYKEAISSCDCVEWIRIIKTLHMRNKERAQQGKKITYVDDRYLKEAKENLYEEFSIALDIEKDNVEQYITDHL